MKAVLKMNAQAGQSEAVNITSFESTAQDDDFQEVKRGKRHISKDASRTAKKPTRSVLISTTVKLPPRVVLNRNLFAPLRTTDMDTETT
jgi:hypothetical protein